MFLGFALWLLLFGRCQASQEDDDGFTYNGFRGANLSLEGLAQITEDGLLMLDNYTTNQEQVGHAFYPEPLNFRNLSSGDAFSFSTTFVLAVWKLIQFGGPGMAFVIAPSRDFSGALPGNYLGLFNLTTIGKSSNHIIGIELDTILNKEFNDIDSNHVGIDINDLKSVQSAPASYFNDEKNRYVNISLIDRQPLQIWVEYHGEKKQLNVTLAPVEIPKPKIPLLSLNIDLSQIIMDSMFVGFSSSTYAMPVCHLVLGWSFKMNGVARELNLSQLPKLPYQKRHETSNVAFPVVAGAALVLLVSILFIIRFILKRKGKFAELLEDWELDCGPHRFNYKDLYSATKGFKNSEILGAGGFGKVYRGVLPNSKTEVAVKRVSHNSKQAEREFIAEITSIGKLRHRYIVSLLGYCRRKGELLLVYDFMPNGSLDKFLHGQATTKTMQLSWCQRFQIIKNVAAALLYLHEEWEQIVVHRDVKSNNVLLDMELNGRLGDFGLARLYDHGSDPDQTTHVLGTLGYLAPEVCATGKPSPSVDVFGFGALLLEVACGRRPIEPEASEECMVLVDWVISCWSKCRILNTVDPKLGINYDVEEMELVLKLGLLCSHSVPTARPCMRQVMRYLEREISLPRLTPSALTSAIDITSINGA